MEEESNIMVLHRIMIYNHATCDDPIDLINRTVFLVYILYTDSKKKRYIVYALVICNHGPPTPGNSGDFDFCPADPC